MKQNDLLVGKGRPKVGPSRPRAINQMICLLATVGPRKARVGKNIKETQMKKNRQISKYQKRKIADSVTGPRKSCTCDDMLFESSLGSMRGYHIYIYI